MDYLPIFLSLRSRRAVVIGGGGVAARKTDLLLQAGAQVQVVAPELCDELQRLQAAGRIDHLAREFHTGDVEGAAAVIAATDHEQTNAAVSRAAQSRNVPVNVVDDPRRSSFIFPAIVDRSPVVVAVGTAGNAPVLARYVREKIEALLPPQLGRLATLAGRWRGRVKSRLKTIVERRRFWERVLEGPVATHALAGRDDHADFELRRELKRAVSEGIAVNPDADRSAGEDAQEGQARRGEVYLIGAGPGDPDLLTLKAARLLQRADVVLYDRLVSPDIVARARRDAERIYVGKAPGEQQTTQEDIHQLMLRLARQGKRVCRLKGGDPFIFGRGGEELEALARHGIPCTVVPGITAALGAAAYAGIPLTHRDCAQSVTFVTGHQRADDQDGAAIDWQELARPGQTTVFYMGLSQLPNILAQLGAEGAPLSRPAALIERATFEDQRVIEGTLGTLAQRVEAARVRSPSLLIVGDVVALRGRAQVSLPQVLNA